MTRAQKSILTLLGLTACFLIGLIGWYGYQVYLLWQTPLGPALSLPTLTPFSLPPTWTPGPTTSALPGQAYRPPATFTPLPFSTPTSAPLCGGPPVMTLLVIGSDQRGDSYLYGLADAIRLVRVDFVTPRVTVLEFPRDLWVEIPEIEDDIGVTHEKLNQAYLYGNPGFGYWDHPSAGPGLLARTLDLNFGARADHYVAVNMQTFVKVVDAVGGMDIYLPEAVDGRTAEDKSSRLLFPAGQQHLDGTRALTLARIRIEGVFERASHQNLVMCALWDKVTSPTVIPQIPELIASFQDNVQTDLTPEQIGQLACLGPQLRSENIAFAAFAEELFTGTRIYDPVFKKKLFIWDADYDVLRDYVARFNSGAWPVPSTSSAPEDEASVCP